MIKNVHSSSCKVPFILADFNETWIFKRDFRKILIHQISWKFVRWEPSFFHTDLRTDMTKIIAALRNFAIEPKNWESVENLRQNILRSPYYLEALERWALLHLSVRGLKVPELNYTAPWILGLQISVVKSDRSTGVSTIITFVK